MTAKRTQGASRPWDRAPKAAMREPTLFNWRKAAPRRRKAWRGGPAGVGEQGTLAWGFPRNLGDLDVSAGYEPVGGHRDNKAQAPGEGCPAAWGAKETGQEAVALSEGNEARGEGRRGVGASRSTVEPGEPTRGTPGREGDAGDREPVEGKTVGTSGSGAVSTGLHRVAELAREAPGMAFTTLAHHIDIGLLHVAYQRTRKDGAVGVDGGTAEAYAVDLWGNLRSLLERLKSGRYHAPPVRRVHIPKGDGKTRPIGIPTFEDKVLQRAVAMVLEVIYEQDFRACSHGFRPGRSAHGALEELWQGLTKMRGGWAVEVDIRSFFDTLDHGHLRSFLDRRVRDGVLRRAIDKWLKAGVMEAGSVTHPEAGTPQGGVISPLLANVYLHEVMDVWFEDVVKPRLKGPSFMVRYADDLVIGCRTEGDARTVLDVLPKRFGKYGLALHPEKTRLVRFLPPRREDDGRGDAGQSGSFDFLGFTHYWGRSLKGSWVVKRKTAGTRFSRALKAIGAWMRAHRHDAVAEQHESLGRKLRGHYAYYGITGNGNALARFLFHVRRGWLKWLGRRSQRGRLNWEQYTRLLARYPLPPARVVHSVFACAASP